MIAGIRLTVVQCIHVSFYYGLNHVLYQFQTFQSLSMHVYTLKEYTVTVQESWQGYNGTTEMEPGIQSSSCKDLLD